MKKILFIIVFSLIFFMTEYFSFNILGSWFNPDFLLLFIIFVTLWLGVRYSIFTAALAGVLKDSFSISPFGINLLSFLLCAYVTVVLKKYIYRYGSVSRTLLIFLIILLNSLLQFILRFVVSGPNILDSIKFVIVPEVIMTLLVSSFTFHFLKKCASKLYV